MTKRSDRPFGRKYSGGASKPFWARVKRLQKTDAHRELYSLGCALQDLEERVLRALEGAEAGDR